MPSRRRLSLSPQAEDDLADILQYTERRWGVAQADAYEATLQRALLELLDFPNMGRARPDLPAGYRTRVVEEHVIYYRVEGDTIPVSRIAHGRRDIKADSSE